MRHRCYFYNKNQGFLGPEFKGSSAVSKDEVCTFYGYFPEFERFVGFHSKWKTRVFKDVCLSRGYRINPDRPNGRWLKRENGEPKDWYLRVPT